MATIFAGDESGNLGFSFKENATSHFVVALARFEDPDSSRELIEKFKASRRLASRELSFNELVIHQWTQTIFDFLATLPFQGWALTIDKRQLPYPYQLVDSKGLYALFVSETVSFIPFALRDHANLVMDEFNRSGVALHQMRKALKIKGLEVGFKKIVAKRSSSEPLIQVADLVAGAAHQVAVQGKSSLFERIKSKVEVAEFEG